MKSPGRPLFRCHGRTVAGQFRIEHGSQCQRDRIDGLKSIDNVQHKKQRDMVGLAFHIRFLNLFYTGSTIDSQHRTGQMAVILPDFGGLLRLRPRLLQLFCAVKPVACYLKKLPCFLLQAHIV